MLKKKNILPFFAGVSIAFINMALILWGEARVVVVIDMLTDRIMWIATKKPGRR
jgi:hypothetical protein